MKDRVKPPVDQRLAERRQRLAEELRANLGKRRAQVRARRSASASAPDETEALREDGAPAPPKSGDD